MKINIEIDDGLMSQAQKLTNIKTKSELIDIALRLYVTIGNQKKLMELWGKVEFDDELSKMRLYHK